MRNLLIFTLLFVSFRCVGDTTADVVPQPILISKAQLGGSVFKDFPAQLLTHDAASGSYATEDVEVFLSKDRQFDAGMYRSEAVRSEITEPYGVNEFMYFLEGGVTLTSADGTVTRVNAGDAVVISEDWMGVWDTQGYTKIYVIYSPHGPIEP